jgi:hypothetical protein
LPFHALRFSFVPERHRLRRLQGHRQELGPTSRSEKLKQGNRNLLSLSQARRGLRVLIQRLYRSQFFLGMGNAGILTRNNTHASGDSSQ